MDNTKVLNLKEDIKWIGILDPTLVTFDVVMETQYGTTYNSYFIDADKKTIIETSKDTYQKEYLEKVKSVVNPEEIEYIVMNHTEPDHSGNLKELLKIAPNATVVASKTGVKFLRDITNQEFKHIIVSDGDTLDLGNKTLRFIGAPFLHWPDTIYTYVEEDKVLFSCDSFGCHYCNKNVFEDQVGDFSDAFKYYFDVIMSPFSQHMLNAIEKVEKLDIDIIAPGHGPVLRDNWKKWVETTKQYAKDSLEHKHEGKPNALITYVSAYGNTKRIAELIAKGIESAGDIDVELLDVESGVGFETLEGKVEKADAILIGTPTINQNTFPQIYQVFGAINPVTSRGKIAGAFGSYGWSGEAVGIVNNIFKLLKLKPHGDGLKVLFVPKEDQEENECTEFGREIGESLIESFK